MKNILKNKNGKISIVKTVIAVPIIGFVGSAVIAGFIEGVTGQTPETQTAQTEQSSKPAERKPVEKKAEKKSDKPAESKPAPKPAEKSFSDKLAELGVNDYSVKMDGKTAIVTYELGATWNETSTIEGFARDGVEVLEQAKGDKLIDDVIITTTTDMIDAKGNSSHEQVIAVEYTQANISEINFDNWSTTVSMDKSVFYNLADTYQIAVGIFFNADQKLQDAIVQPSHVDNMSDVFANNIIVE